MSNKSSAILTACILALWGFSSAVFAQTTSGTFTGPGTNWSDPANWTSPDAPGAVAGDAASFSTISPSLLNGRVILLDAGNVTLGELNVTGPSSSASRTTLGFDAAAGKSFIFDSGIAGTPAELNLSGNVNLTINPAVSLGSDLEVNNLGNYVNTLAFTNTVAIGGNTLYVNPVAIASTVRLGGALAGSGTLVKTGGGTLVLANANTAFAGKVRFEAGTISLEANNALGASPIVVTTGNAKAFAVIGARTLANTLAFDASAASLAVNGGSGSSLTLGASGATTLGAAATTFNIDANTSLIFGASHAITGAGSLVKDGYGTLTLSSGNSTFDGLIVRQGYVNTSAFTGELVLGAASAGKNILGSGNITVMGDDTPGDETMLTLTGANASALVTFGGGLVTISNNAKLRIENAGVALTSGTIDFGTGALKGNLFFNGDVTLGDTVMLNTTSAVINLGKNVAINAGSLVAAGTPLVMRSETGAARGLTVNGVATIADLTVSGTGLVTHTNSVGGATTTFAKLSFIDSGSLSLGGGSVGIGSLYFDTGALVAGAATQLDGAAVSTLGGVSNTLSLGGHDQAFGSLALAANTQFLIDFGSDGGSTATALGLGNTTLGANSILKFRNYSAGGSLTDDLITTLNTLSSGELSQVWFYGYNKGAEYDSGNLVPIAGNYLESVFDNKTDGLATTGNWNWFAPTNWVGDDEFNIPNFAGAKATISAAAIGSTLGAKTVNLGGGTVTLGSLSVDPTAHAGGYFVINSGTFIFDNHGAGGTLKQITGVNLQVPATIVLKDDLTIHADNYVLLNGIVAGDKNITKTGAGTLYIWSNAKTAFSGTLFLEQGILTSNMSNPFGPGGAGDWLGAGSVVLRAGVFYGYNGYERLNYSGAFGIEGNVALQRLNFNGIGVVNLDSVYSLNVNGATTNSADYASVTFGEGIDFTGVGGLTKIGGYGLEMLGDNSTFSGGLTINAGILYTTIGSDGLRLGAVEAGKNYLGSGNLSLSGANSIASVNTDGNNALFQGADTLHTATIALNNGSSLRFTGDGAVTLGGDMQIISTSGAGILSVAGDVIFAGATYGNGTDATRSPTLRLDTSTNTTGQSYVKAGGAAHADITNLSNIAKYGNGISTFYHNGADAANVNTIKANGVYAYGGILQLGKSDQLIAGSLVLQGGAFDANDYSNTISTLYLRDNGSLILGGTGRLSFSSANTSSNTHWNRSKVLLIQNADGVWNSDGTGAYVRLNSNNFTGDNASLLGNIAFTGWEAGAKIEQGADGKWYLLPDTVAALPTIEWAGGAGDAKWSTASNWRASQIPNSTTASVSIRDIDTNLTAKTIDVDGNYDLNHLNIEAFQAGVNFGGSGTLTFHGTGALEDAAFARIKHAGSSILTIDSDVRLAADTELVANVTPSENTTVYSGYVVWNGRVFGNSKLVKTGGGMLRITGDNKTTWTGGVELRDSNFVQIGASHAFGSGALVIGGALEDTQTLEAWWGGGASVKLPTAGGDIAANLADATRVLENDWTLNGSLKLQRETDNGTGTEAGAITHLRMTGDGVLSSGTHNISVWGANGTYYGGITAAAEANDRNSYQMLMLDGNISGEGGIAFNGYGALMLGGANTFTGGVRLNGGEINVAHDRALGASSGTISFGNMHNSLRAWNPDTNSLLTAAGSTRTISNPLNFNGSNQTFRGNFTFDHSGTSTLAATTALFVFNEMIFGKDHIIEGAGKLRKVSYGGGTIRLQAPNTYSGGTDLNVGILEIGTDSVLNPDGTVQSGALGTGELMFYDTSGILAAYADDGSTSRTLSNAIAFASGNSGFIVRKSAFASNTASTLILDTPTITLKGGNSYAISVQTGATLAIKSHLLDTNDTSGFTSSGAGGIIELSNAANKITGGINITNSGTVRAVADITSDGHVTIGAVDDTANYLGTGVLSVSNANGAFEIITEGVDADNPAIVSIASCADGQSSIVLNNGGKFKVLGSDVVTFLGDGATLGSTTAANRGTLVSAGLIRASNATVGVKLSAPSLEINGGVFALTAAGLVGGVQALTLDDGTLHLGGHTQALGGGIQVSGNSIIDFGANTSLTKFTTGDIFFDAGGQLTFSSWKGNAITGGGLNQIIVSGVSSEQRYADVSFGSQYALGGKTIKVGGDWVLVPFGIAYAWDGRSGSDWGDASWQSYDSLSGNYYNTNATPNHKGMGATFGALDSSLNGKTIGGVSNMTIAGIGLSVVSPHSFTIGTAGEVINLDSDGGNTYILSDALSQASMTIDAGLNLELDRGIGLNNFVVTHDGSGTITLNGVIEGNQAMIKRGAGTLVLAGANTFTEGFALESGLVRIAADGTAINGPLGAGKVILKGGALEALGADRTLLANPLEIAGSFSVLGDHRLTFANVATSTVSTSATVTIDTNAALNLAGALAGTGTFAKAGQGVLILAGDNSAHTAGIELAAGKIEAATNTALGAGALNVTGDAILSNTTAASVALSNTIVLATGKTLSLENTATTALALGGLVTGDGALAKTGAGALRVTGSNDYAGGTQITSGSLVAQNAAALGSGSVTIGATGNLALDFSGTFANILAGGGTTHVQQTAVTLTADNSDYTGDWFVHGSSAMTVSATENIGTGDLLLAGSLYVASSGNFVLGNKIDSASPYTGNISLYLTEGGTLSFASTAQGGNFNGIVNIHSGVLNLDSVAGNATNGVLRDAAISLVSGTLNLDGDQTVRSLVLFGSGVTAVDFGQEKLSATDINIVGPATIDSNPAGAGGLLSLDDGVSATIAQSANAVTGDISSLRLKGALDSTTMLSNIIQGSDTALDPTAKAVHNYAFSAMHGGTHGIFLSSTLTAIEIQSGKTFTLGQTDGDGAQDFKALITQAAGSPANLAIAAGATAGDLITLAPAAAYTHTGTTTIASGSVAIAASAPHALFASSTAFQVDSGATLVVTNSVALNHLGGAGKIALTGGGITLNNTIASQYDGVFEGAARIEKTGASTLTLTAASTAFTGTTLVTGGTLRLENLAATGTGRVTVASSAVLDLADGGNFANNIVGNGAAVVSENGVNLIGANTIAAWNITGSGTVSGTQNLGVGSVNLAGGQLALAPAAGGWTFTNTLGGDGTLTANFADATGTLAFASGLNNAFTGTLAMRGGHLALDANAGSLLVNAALVLGQNGSTEINANRTIGALEMDGGTLMVETTGAQVSPTGTLTVTDLVAGSGTIKMSKPVTVVDDTDVINAPSFFAQTGTVQQMIVNATGSVTGTGVQLDIVQYDGTPVSGNAIATGIRDASNAVTGTARYDFHAAVTGSGIGWAYGLVELSANAGASITLSNSNASQSTLGVKLTGSGGYTMSGTGVYSIGNAASDYEGATLVTGGTVRMLTDNAFGGTPLLDLAANTGVDMNGKTQATGTLNTAAGSTLDLNAGVLTLANGGTSLGALTGSGTLNTAGHLDIRGANTGLSADIANTGTIRIDNTDGLGRSGTLANGNLLSIDTASGTFAKSVTGAGNIALASSTVTLGGNNAAFTGTFDIAAGSRLAASANENLGAANLVGAGVFEKQNTATTITLTHANNAFTGTTLVTGGTLRLENLAATGTGAMVNNAALDLAATGDYASNITGSGTTFVTANGVNITGVNTGSAWNITGSGTVSSTANLGAGDTHIDGLLVVKTGDSWLWGNTLTGSGTLSVNLSGSTFSFGSSAVSPSDYFEGTVTLANTTMNLGDDSNVTALKNATLQLDAGSALHTNAVTGTIGGLTLNSGKLWIPKNGVDPAEVLNVGTLSITDASSLIVFENYTSGTHAAVEVGKNFLDQDGPDSNATLLVKAGTLAEHASHQLDIVKADGTALSEGQVIDYGNVEATYGYAAITASATTSTGHEGGLYYDYVLRQLNVKDGETLVLTSTGATDNTLSADITGLGGVTYTTGSLIVLTGSNSYTGTSTLVSGTVRADADNALGNTKLVIVEIPATFDLNGNAQTIAEGGQIDGHITGTGALTLAGGTLTITSANTDYTAQTAIGAAATARLTDAEGLGSADILLDGMLTFETTGTARNTLSGAGTLHVAGGEVTLVNSSTDFHGTGTVAAGRLVAAQIDALGDADIGVASGAAFEQTGVTGTLQNNITGEGAHYVTGGTVTIANTAYDIAVTTLDQNAQLKLARDAVNFGTLNMRGGTLLFANPTDTATIATLGDTSGLFVMNADLAAQTANRLDLVNAGSATHAVYILDAGIEPTAHNISIEIITAQTPGAADFVMANPGGKLEYALTSIELVRGDSSIYAPNPDSWYLLDQGLSHSADAIINTASALALDWASSLDAIHTRLGDIRSETLGSKPSAGGMWFRSRGYRLNAANELSGMSFKQYGWGVTGGADKAFATQAGVNFIGGFIDMGNVDRRLDNAGDGKTRSVGAGVYLTMLGNNGWFLDGTARFDRYNNEFDAKSVSGRVTHGKYNTNGQSLSLEAGRRLQRADGWWIEPGVQMAVLWLKGSDYSTRATVGQRAIDVSVGDSDTWQYRAMVRAGRQIRDSKWHPYGKFAVVAVDSNGGRITAHDKTFKADYDGRRVEIGFGTSYRLSDISQLYLDYEYAKAAYYDRPWSLNLGYRRLW
ncbi:autotransporter-associated beta strand protein [Ereboglobus sp. PH5-10]|uniref:autotransporter-associated beta strand repeat-containing protein n=1 Tax=Ereboglobus sp. PH5-10 TaxID=2940629 RepID=UPI002406F9DB|nr:autotransporter-associated beta strand repeat-containing protein [Ereboglobus sp. PH5-10]MDF9827758.1 autotransporter-associated beta strand protein [Ereboglobus sp. PH5-10]